MGYFGEDILQGFFGVSGLKDYSHASKTFRSNGYDLAPRTKFLFHVFFNVNFDIPQLANLFAAGDLASVGLLVKTAQLPSYSIDVATMNQYNRKRLVQTKLNYNPVQLVFHDDTGDLIRNMWYQYYQYYYNDPSYKYGNTPNQAGTMGNLATLQNGFGYNASDIYNNSRQVQDWGYMGETYTDSGIQGSVNPASNQGKPPFFKDITIYGLSQKKFAQYTLINPMIDSWQHDTYDYSQGAGTMSHTMSIKYETVKYYSGPIGGATPSNSVVGFADPAHYDTTKSALARPGGTATVFGQGGLLDAVAGSTQDLQALASGNGGLQNVLGLVQKAGTAYNTFKNQNIASIATTEAKIAAVSILQNSLPGAVRQAVNSGNGQLFPKPPNPAAQNITTTTTGIFSQGNNP